MIVLCAFAYNFGYWLNNIHKLKNAFFLLRSNNNIFHYYLTCTNLAKLEAMLYSKAENMKYTINIKNMKNCWFSM